MIRYSATYSRCALLGAIGLLGLTLAGCGDTKAQKEVKQQAEAIDQSAEAQAKLMEARALGAPNQKAVDNQADAVRAKGEQTKDHLTNMADELDDVPKK